MLLSFKMNIVLMVLKNIPLALQVNVTLNRNDYCNAPPPTIARQKPSLGCNKCSVLLKHSPRSLININSVDSTRTSKQETIAQTHQSNKTRLILTTFAVPDAHRIGVHGGAVRVISEAVEHWVIGSFTSHGFVRH